ncbi:MAG TPA: GNAT family N-acetyltransferase [Nocardioidaceae bacterium]|jgi:GNAT superfamily N-acetyltransferase
MQVREIDVHDDDEVARWWEVARSADAHGRDYAAYWSLRAAMVALRAENSPFRQQPIAAFDRAGMVGVDKLMLPLADNTHMAFVAPMVLPEHRRRGVGSALLETSLDMARVAGRTTAVTEVNLPLDPEAESAGLTFTRRHGFELGILDIHRVLDLPVSDRRLDELTAAAAPHHHAFRLSTWIDAVPEEYMDGFCELQIAFNSEAPMGELELENEVWDAERVRSTEERFRKQGRHEVSTVAIASDGTLVGLTQLMTTEENRAVAWQGGTLVLKSARGHRLGIAMKAQNLRRFQPLFPDSTVVHSWNAEENGPMVAINETLGFRPVERLAEMQKKL